MTSFAPEKPPVGQLHLKNSPLAISAWLFSVAALVFIMVVVGGITRLTESGLSIVRWDVVSGTLPPLTAQAWSDEFQAYQASSQYQLMNQGMSLADFKGIYFWEYIHRLLGRLIGLAFVLPLALFWLRKQIPAGYKPRLLALLALGGLQGAIGWWMVTSGLVGRTEVAHTRLAVHLTAALAIIAGCIWTALDLRRPPRPSHPKTTSARLWVPLFAALLTIQIIWGAFTAGLRAGHASDTWPLMAGALIPSGLASNLAGWANDPFTVHFVHRSLAILVFIAALIFVRHLWKIGARLQAQALALAITLQFALGVLTVLSGVALSLGVAHQAGGALLVIVTTWATHHSLKTVGNAHDR